MSGSGSGGKAPEGKGEGLNPNVEDMFHKLHLTAEEEAVLDLSSEDEEETMAPAMWALVGKILSPVPIHAETIRSAMRPAWGNPVGLKIRTVGEKGDNTFVVEFGSARDMERVLSGAPWMVKKYVVLLQEYDATLSASSIVFDKVEMWVRILDLLLGWMNREKGARVMDMIGKVVSMDVDSDGKASGAFLRARVSIEIDRPIRRGIFLRLKRGEEPKWFKVQYEKLPYICFSCGKLGHSDLECPTPAERDEEGKLPYGPQRSVVVGHNLLLGRLRRLLGVVPTRVPRPQYPQTSQVRGRRNLTPATRRVWWVTLKRWRFSRR